MSWLRAGDRIAVVAPSSPFDRDRFEAGAAWLRERYELVYAQEELFAREGFFAGTDSHRAACIRRALADASVRAIVAVRGGYGAGRIVGDLDAKAVERAGKLLVGFSDVTVLHALWQHVGLASVHGPMVASLAEADEPTRARWIDAVEGRPLAAIEGLETITPGAVEGRLTGGNLAVLASLAGTPFMPPLEGRVLFLEDVTERPYRIDRMLTTLRECGALRAVAGIAFGAFTECEPNADGVRASDVLAERTSDLGIPVVQGVLAGHIASNAALRLGVTVRLDADAGTLAWLDDR